jgi:ATP-dependent Zn protease
MMRQQRAKRLRETAYHEAGHAVAAFRLRVAFRYVDIIPEGDQLGAVVHYQWVRSQDFALALGGAGELTLRAM